MALRKEKVAQVPLAARVQLNEELDHMEDVFSREKKTTDPTQSMYWYATHKQLNKEMFAKRNVRERIKRFLKRKN